MLVAGSTSDSFYLESVSFVQSHRVMNSDKLCMPATDSRLRPAVQKKSALENTPVLHSFDNRT